MAKFTSTSKTATSIADHVLEAFNLDSFEDFNIKSIEGVGVIVNITKGDNKGSYDYYPEDTSFITA
ncbi:hypothetical protein [Pseudoalteromonas phage PS_L5]|nr:hypothetical protein [Pseudoalteromonas phage PS_L5]